MKTCTTCIRKDDCEILSGEMLIRFKELRKFDLIKEIKKFKKELAGKCSHYNKKVDYH